MRNLLILIVLLTSISCSNNSSNLTKLTNQSAYLEKEFIYFNEKMEHKYISNLAKWGDCYDKVFVIKEMVSNIEQTFKNGTLLAKPVYSSIDSFISTCHNSEIDEGLIRLYKSEYDFWKSEYEENQSLTKIEKELLLITVRTLRNSICREYYNSVERLNYKFSHIRPSVNVESNRIKKGEKYKAEILIGAYDPSIVPLCEIQGYLVKPEEGIFYLEIPCNQTGTFTWKGVIKMPDPLGRIIVPYPIEGQYIVK